MTLGPDRPSISGGDGVAADIFEKPPALTQYLDQTEEAIRARLAKLRIFDRVFLLHRDWMTRITMLMIVLALFWGAVGAFDAFGFQSQVVAWVEVEQLHLSNQEIYSSVTLHGIRMLFGFAQQLEMAIFGLLVINALGIVPRYKWRLYASVALINLSIILIQGPIYLAPFNDNYFPSLGWYFLSPLGVNGQSLYVASPLWFLGWLALCASVFLWSWWMLSHFWAWWRQRSVGHPGERFPVFLLFILATIALILVSYVPLVVSTVWDLGTYFGNWPIDPLVNQVIFWLFGHGVVYVLFLIPVTGLYLLLPILARRPVYSYRWAFVAAVLFVLLTPLLGVHHLFLAPLPSWLVWLTMVISFLIIIPSAITFFSLWMTLKGVRPSQWEWNAVALFSLLAFAGSILGGLSGPAVATVPWNVDLHNSLFVLSHFHALTILAIVAGGYAFVYAFFPILSGRAWFSAWLARAHFALTAIGGVALVVSFDDLGNLGILRRAFMVPPLPPVILGELLLYAAIIILCVGQLLFVANGVLTVFRGALFSSAGLSFDEAVRKAAQGTVPRRGHRVSVGNLPFVRRLPRSRRERTEKIWVSTVAILVALVLVAYTPAAFGTSNAIGTPGAYPAGTEFVTMNGLQYYWSVNESGAVVGSFDNVIVAQAGQAVSINATASGATQDLYIPFRSQPVVSIQVVPGSTSYTLFTAPTVPGVYAVPNGEFNGPWFSQDVAALVVIPAGGAYPTLDQFVSSGGAGDIYNPPVVPSAGTELVGNQEGVFNSSVPGPTLTASAGPVSFRWTVPLSSIGIDNYLVNVTSNDPNQQQQYVIDQNYTLPYLFGIWQIDPTVGLVPVEAAPLVINSDVTASATLPGGAYLYGITAPIDYSYDPDGQSGITTGSQTGYVMGLWGVLWVSG
ncbi:MAG: cbb3-type cytochrome c oxidase subunit I [Thermoplasmata archaeon]